MAKGFLQKEGIDFDEIFAPVARIGTIWLVVGLTNMNKMDVKCELLNETLDEEVNVTQPVEFMKQV